MPATFVVRLSNQILVPIVALCLFAYICGVAVIIASVFSHLNSKSIISVSHHRSKQFYSYISSFVSYRYFNLTKVTHKENHFVPKTFLKSWALRDGKNLLVNTLSLNDNCQRKQPTSSIAKKKNLYTLTSDFQTNDHKIVEHIIFKIWEDRWPSVLFGLNKNELSKDQIRDLKGFVITQSFRTPKFEKENVAIIEAIDNEVSADLSFKYFFAFLGTEGFTNYIKNSTCEVLFSRDSHNFICSDNPSTHWLINEHSFTYINGIAGRLDLMGNRNYKIVCPLTPKHLVILSPNLDLDISENQKESCVFKEIDRDDLIKFNEMIKQGADKFLIAKNNNDFE